MKLDKVLTAVYGRDIAVLSTLPLEDIQIKDEDGRTPLMHAILAENTDEGVVRMLVERGADVNTADTRQRWTALHFAARDQKTKIVEILLEHGAAVDAVNVFGNTPLMEAVSNSSPNLLLIANLVKHKADPCRKNNYGVAPLDLARMAGKPALVSILNG
jgi:ankyrin repeat protein